MSFRYRVAFSALFVVVAACSSSEETKSPAAEAVLPPLSTAITTVDQLYVPKHKVESSSDNINPAIISAQADFISKGYGEVIVEKGEPYHTKTIDDSTPPAAGAGAKRLTRFAHLADLQIADDESPTRLASFDLPVVADAAMRPQDAYLCRMMNACVRTINAFHKMDPIDFVVLGGDNADSAQTNEVDWVLKILNGSSEVKCDSGKPNDIIPGPNNDGKDAFPAEGLAMPWKWVTGNHDVLVQGNLQVADKKELVLGSDAPSGTRDWARGGEVDKWDDVVPDPKRALLSRTELMKMVGSDGDGHGLGAEQMTSGKAYYTFDIPNTQFRFLVLDTGSETGGSEGLIRQGDVDQFVKPALDKAKTDKKWVILSSHHAVASLGDGTGLGGSKQADALTKEAWIDLIGSYDNVVMSLVGHTHEHKVSKISPPNGHPWWEIMTSAIADFPHQFRTIEIFDQDNGWLMFRATCSDFSVENDAVALYGRTLGVIDFTTGWKIDGRGVPDQRNVELWIQKPQ
jgi:3',5'-cyclic AMP phosphodiesterase CpdA